jgi:peptidoglycan/xylan/chitin deacetylase (PgdA/CDA1 family)
VTRATRAPSRSRHARAAATLQRSGLGAVLRRLGAWRGLLVLTYHRIGDARESPLDPALFSASAEEFGEHVADLDRHADVIALEDVPAALRQARGRKVLITFDDGYRDGFEVALPVLRRAGLPAAFFLVTGYLDRPRLSWWDELAWMGAGPEAVAAYKRLGEHDTEPFLNRMGERTGRGRAPPDAGATTWLTWDMARAMRDAGMSFGGHTVNHPVLARISPERQRDEIRGCARRIADELGTVMRAFSYPVGSADAFDATAMRLVREAGCDVSFALVGGHARPRRADPLAVPRMSVGPWLSRDELRAALVLPQLFATG